MLDEQFAMIINDDNIVFHRQINKIVTKNRKDQEKCKRAS